MSLLAIVPYPRGFRLTRQQNTWSGLHFKWMALRFHSPVGGSGGEAFAFFVSLFSHQTSEKYTLSRQKDTGNQTLPLRSIPTHWIAARKADYFTGRRFYNNMYLKVLPTIYISVSTSRNWVVLLLYRWSGYRTAIHWVAFLEPGLVTKPCDYVVMRFPETSTATMACVWWRVCFVSHGCLRLCWHPKHLLWIIYCSNTDV